MKKISVEVKPDHLETMSRVRKPILAVAELVWNGLDADATEIHVQFGVNALGGLDVVRVTDNGHGLPYDEALKAFRNLGGSWKRQSSRTRIRRRILHGRLGKGRFRAFALGNSVEWKTKYKSNGNLEEFSISALSNSLGTFIVGDPQSANGESGTVVEVRDMDKNFPSLYGQKALQEITELFALYLREYSDVRIIYDGASIDPTSVQEHTSDYALDPTALEDGRVVAASLTVIEWQVLGARALYLCDANGFALHEIPPGIHAPSFNFTAYLKADFLRELDDQGSLSLDELHPDLKKLLDQAKERLRDHFRKRAAETAISKVDEWKAENVYPYEGQPKNLLEETERQVFDVCALNLSAYLPDFERSDQKSKKLALTLLKHALESDPTAVRRILEEVLVLPEEKQEELAELLKRTTLAAIINASKVVADRLEFLTGLEYLLFDKQMKKALLERSELHRLLAENTWVFGEQFNLSVDDGSLNQVLEKHLHLLGRSQDDLEPVKTEKGSRAIVDLMLSRRIPQPRANEREHLVVELKRPSVAIDGKVLQQIENYAFAVAEDERFKGTETKWVFWAVSNELSTNVQRKARQKGRPEGVVHEDEEMRLTVWVKTWGQVVQDCKARLQFFQEQLVYRANQDSAMEYLRLTHEKYLPKLLKRKLA